MPEPGGHQEELARIRRSYAKREAAEIAGRYTWFAPDYLLAMQAQERALLTGLRELGLTACERLRVLDVGCGTGSFLLALLRYGFAAEHLHGVDLIEERVAAARGRLPSQVTLSAGSATKLDYPDGYFHLVSQYTVFSSVLDRETARGIATEMWRVLAPGGSIVWFDFRYDNPANPDVRGIPWREARALFPQALARARYLQLAPPIARRVAPLSLPLAQALAAIPSLRSHLFATFTKPATEAESRR